MRPRLASYAFPAHLVNTTGLTASISRLETALATGLEGGEDISYRAPWTSVSDIEAGSIDLIFSQAVLQHVDDLRQAYEAMFMWLKPGGYCSHSIGFRAHYVAPFWNGHWAYSDLEWRIVRGRREWLLNRQPMSTHLALARQAGFEVVEVEPEQDDGGLPLEKLAMRFRTLGAEDLRTSGAMIVLRKPQTA